MKELVQADLFDSDDFIEVVVPTGVTSYSIEIYDKDGKYERTYSLGSLVKNIHNMDLYLINKVRTDGFKDLKDEEAIAILLGSPSETAGTAESERRLVYRQPPAPLETLELVTSESGVCIQVTGTTSTGFDTPEALLDAIGLGEVERQRAGRDPLGMNYEIAGVGAVQVHRPSSTVSEYRNFTVTAE